jgi:DNA-binding PadR family transcriptional regulator
MIKKRITFESQDIYKSITFYNSVNFLTKKKVIKQETFQNDKRKKIYSLTQKGEILAMMLSQFTNQNPER